MKHLIWNTPRTHTQHGTEHSTQITWAEIHGIDYAECSEHIQFYAYMHEQQTLHNTKIRIRNPSLICRFSCSSIQSWMLTCLRYGCVRVHNSVVCGCINKHKINNYFVVVPIKIWSLLFYIVCSCKSHDLVLGIRHHVWIFANSIYDRKHLLFFLWGGGVEKCCSNLIY